ncbi:MAG: Crp/Fnr family transcriptional regulator [Rhodoferax sp.]|nr:MAG: Crp/Fnr family transcriptional regulator [Rhodoferax sp.]
MFADATSHQERCLSHQKWFRELPVHLQQLVQSQAFSVRAAKGEVALKAYQPVEGWYGVAQGLVKIASSQGSQQSTFIGLNQGSWFGEGAVLKNEARQYDVVALRDTELVCIPSAVFETLLSESTCFNRFVIDELNRKLGLAMSIIQAGRSGTAQQRLALALSRMFWNQTRTLELSQDELANLAGMARQTANRALQHMEQRGIVRLAMNRITVLDERALLQCVSDATALADPK